MRTDSTLIERYVEVFFTEISEEKFAIAEEKYANALKDVTPNCFKEESRQWFFNFQEKDNDFPEISDKHLKITNNYWECPSSKGDPMWRVRLERNRFVLNFRKRLVADPGTKVEFFAFVLSHLKKLRQFFEITKWKNFRLTYFFRLDASHIDDVSLVRPNWIEVKELLHPFASMPTVSGFKRYIYPCNINLHWEQLHDEVTCRSGLVVNSNTNKSSNNSLDIQMFTESAKICEAKTDDSILANLSNVIHINYKNVMTDKMRSGYEKDLQ